MRRRGGEEVRRRKRLRLAGLGFTFSGYSHRTPREGACQFVRRQRRQKNEEEVAPWMSRSDVRERGSVSNEDPFSLTNCTSMQRWACHEHSHDRWLFRRSASKR